MGAPGDAWEEAVEEVAYGGGNADPSHQPAGRSSCAIGPSSSQRWPHFGLEPVLQGWISHRRRRGEGRVGLSTATRLHMVSPLLRFIVCGSDEGVKEPPRGGEGWREGVAR